MYILYAHFVTLIYFNKISRGLNLFCHLRKFRNSQESPKLHVNIIVPFYHVTCWCISKQTDLDST